MAIRPRELTRTVTEADLKRLPGPVARSLRRSGVVGRPIPHAVSVTQSGRIRPSEDRPWLKFSAEQTYGVHEPQFEWSARLEIGGLSVGKAVDTLTDGRGRMHVRLLGLFTVVDAHGPEMDQGALMRWLNETMWFPQAWITGQIEWEAVDESSAVASLESNGESVTAEFRFDPTGHLVDFRADRYRDVGGDFVMTPWSTPIGGHGVFGGIELPSRGAAVWALPDGDVEYIRIEVLGVTHHMYT